MAVSTHALDMFEPHEQEALAPEVQPMDFWGRGTPAGTLAPWKDVNKGSLYRQVDNTDDVSCVWLKVDEANANSDWVQLELTVSGPITHTTATLTVTALLHARHTIVLDRAGGIAVTLPAATGSGLKLRFVIATTYTTDGTIKVVGNDTMIGHAVLGADGGATMVHFAASGENDTITLDGADTGGILGAIIELEDIAADLWEVNMISDATGTEVTPFSNTVS